MKNKFKLLFVLVFVSFFSCTTNNSGHKQSSEPDVYNRLKELGIKLTKPETPSNPFVLAVQTDNLVFMSGHGPNRPDSGYIKGKVGGKDGLSVKEGQEAARITGISLLSSLNQEIGDLNKVVRIVKVHGMVNADPSFTQQTQVMNGFSELMVKVFGKEKGQSARAAVGMGSLPMNIPVEIEMVVEVQK